MALKPGEEVYIASLLLQPVLEIGQGGSGFGRHNPGIHVIFPPR